MNCVFLFPNFTKPGTELVAASCIEKLVSLKIRVLITHDAADYLSPSALEKTHVNTYNKCLEECDMIAVIGGDGSILRIASDAAKAKKPILGINTGKVGFMSEIDTHELDLLDLLPQGEYTIDRRMMLEVKIMRRGKMIYSETLLNDAVITKWTLVRLINIDVFINGTLATSQRADGIIISTPTGSTAYTLSAGGPIIEPNADCIAVTPICAHELLAKPFVLSSDREIMITAGAPEHQAFLSPDGKEPFKILQEDKIYITRAKDQTQLIRLKDIGFYELIYKKLSI